MEIEVRIQKRNLEAGSKVEIMEKSECWVATYGLLSLFSCTIQDPISWGGIFPSSWDPPLSINDQETVAKEKKINFHDFANLKKKREKLRQTLEKKLNSELFISFQRLISTIKFKC